MQAVKAPTILRISAVSPEPLLLQKYSMGIDEDSFRNTGIDTF